MTGSSVNSSATHEEYLGIYEDDHSTTATFGSEEVVFGPTPRAGTVRNLLAQISSAHATNGSWIITVHTGLQVVSPPPAVATIPTAVTCSITGTTATTCNGGALMAAVPAGSYVTVRVTRTPTSGGGVTGAPPNRQWRFSFEY